jgi:hypothetical protein
LECDSVGGVRWEPELLDRGLGDLGPHTREESASTVEDCVVLGSLALEVGSHS